VIPELPAVGRDDFAVTIKGFVAGNKIQDSRSARPGPSRDSSSGLSCRPLDSSSARTCRPLDSSSARTPALSPGRGRNIGRLGFADIHVKAAAQAGASIAEGDEAGAEII